MPLTSRQEKFDTFPAIFSNREDNEATVDNLQNALEKFYYDIAEVPREKFKAAVRSVNRLLETVMPRLRRNRFAFRFSSPILSDQLFENLKTIDIDTVEIIIPMIVSRTHWEPTQTGYVTLPLPELKKSSLLSENPWRHFKSRDSKYLSPLQVTIVAWALIRDCLELPWPIKGFVMLPLRLKSDGCVIFLKDIDIDMTVRIVMGIKFDEKETCNLISKPFENDIDPRSDSLWRITYIEQELKILKALEPADRFRRAQALKTLSALTKLDPIFKPLDDYQLLTVLFHLCDDELDEKRWHKKSLRECFYLILNKLLEFLKSGNLPHLYIKNYNLFQNLKSIDKRLLVGRISFMMFNEKEIIRVCKRRTLSYQASTQASIMDQEIKDQLDKPPEGCDDFYVPEDNHLGEEFKVSLK